MRARARATFGSLGVRNYRLFFLGQLVSVVGTWMQSIAQMWLVLRLTGSGLDLGLTTALQFLPTLLFASWGGLLADRSDKRRLLLLTQSAAGAVALVLAGLTLSGVVQVWMVYALALALGCVTAVDNPTRQSFVTEMVGRDQVANAVSLNSAVFTSARMVGPAVAGVLIAFVGTGWCFLYNGLSYFAVVAALLLMRPEQLHRNQPLPRARGQIVEGMRYVWTRRELRLPLLVMLVVGTLAFNFSVVLPLLATYSFHSGAAAFGALMSVMGAGAFAGALASAGRDHPTHTQLATAAIALGVLMLVAAGMPTLALEMAVLVPLGTAMVLFQATANSLLQTFSEPRLRGRVMALYVMVFVGTTPIGGPLVGWVCEQLGPRAGFIVGGVASALAGLCGLLFLLAWRRQAMPAAAAEQVA